MKDFHFRLSSDPTPQELAQTYRRSLAVLEGERPQDYDIEVVEGIEALHAECTNSSCDCSFCCYASDVRLGSAR